MVAKEQAKQAIESLPDAADLDDIMYALYVLTKIRKAEREIDEGKGVPHEEAMKRLSKWLR